MCPGLGEREILWPTPLIAAPHVHPLATPAFNQNRHLPKRFRAPIRAPQTRSWTRFPWRHRIPAWPLSRSASPIWRPRLSRNTPTEPIEAPSCVCRTTLTSTARPSRMPGSPATSPLSLIADALRPQPAWLFPPSAGDLCGRHVHFEIPDLQSLQDAALSAPGRAVPMCSHRFHNGPFE